MSTPRFVVATGGVSAPPNGWTPPSRTGVALPPLTTPDETGAAQAMAGTDQAGASAVCAGSASRSGNQSDFTGQHLNRVAP